MKATFTYDAMKNILDTCSPAVSKDKLREMLAVICLDFEDNVCTAVALDGFVLVRQLETVLQTEDTDFGRGRIYIKPFKLPKCSKVTVEQTEVCKRQITTITWEGENSGSVMQDVPSGQYVNYKNVIKSAEDRETTFTITFDKKILKQAIDADKSGQYMTFRFSTPLSMATIKDHGRPGLTIGVLPVRTQY